MQWLNDLGVTISVSEVSPYGISDLPILHPLSPKTAFYPVPPSMDPLVASAASLSFTATSLPCGVVTMTPNPPMAIPSHALPATAPVVGPVLSATGEGKCTQGWPRHEASEE